MSNEAQLDLMRHMHELMEGTPSLMYTGLFDHKKTYKYGDVFEKDGKVFACNGNKYVELTSVDSLFEPSYDAIKESYDEKQIIAHKCTCCGASLVIDKGVLKCEYCDTIYGKLD